MANQWFAEWDGKEFGPFSTEQVRQLAASGRLRPGDLIRKESMGQFVPARAVKGLFPEATAPQPSSVPGDGPPSSLAAGPDDPRPERSSRVPATPRPADDALPIVLTDEAPPRPIRPPSPLPRPADEALPIVLADEAPPRPIKPASPLPRRKIALMGGGGAAVLALGGVLIFAATRRDEGTVAKPRSPAQEKVDAAARPDIPPVATASTPPVAIAKTPPLAIVSTAVPADYFRLALLIANPYSLDADRWTDPTNMKQLGTMDAAIESVKGTRDPTLRPAVDILEDGRRKADAAAKKLLESADRAKKREKDVQDRAARGEFERTVEEREVVGYNDGRPVFETVTRRVDGSGEARMFAWFNRKFLAGTPESAKHAIYKNLDNSRLEAWEALRPKLGKLYPKSPARDDLVASRASPYDAEKKRPGPFAVVNTAGKTLTDVTLIVDLVHFTDAPNVNSRQVLFLPQWPADQSLYLNSMAESNLVTSTTTLSRPLSARPGWAITPDEGHPLQGAAGAVETRLTVWAAEAHQPEHVVKYPEVAIAGARFELEVLRSLTERELVMNVESGHRGQGRPGPNGLSPMATPTNRKTPVLIPDDYKALPASAWIFRCVPHISVLVPGSDQEREAKAYLADYVDVIRDQRQKQFDLLTRASGDHQKWSGTWSFAITQEKLKAGSAIIPSWMLGGATPPGGEKILEVLKPRVGSNGRIALAFEATPVPKEPARGKAFRQDAAPKAAPDPAPRQIRARIFDPDHPKASHPLVGEITNDTGGERHIILHLVSPATPTFGAKKAKEGATHKPAGEYSLEDDGLSLELVGSETGLKGIARTTKDRYFRMYGFELDLQADK